MSSLEPDPAALAALAEEAARAAGRELLARAGRPANVGSKSSGTDMVSDADRAAERVVLARITSARPHDAVIAEEGGAAEGRTGLRWVVDPLDGTTNYLWGVPHWAVSIAVADGGGALAGVVFDPCRDEMYRAVRGGGAHLNGAPLTVNRSPGLHDALVGTGFNYLSDERARQAARLSDLLPCVRDIRRFGAATHARSRAAGRLDAFFERGLQEWDWAAGALVVREAGGEVVVLPPEPPRPGGVVAGHPDLVGPLHALVEGGRG